MSIFEAVMLFCFGVSWPIAIYKTYRTKNPVGKSVPFLYLVFIGYLAGCIHKIKFNCDYVLALYILNATMVLADLILTKYYLNRKRREILDPKPPIMHSGDAKTVK